MSTSTIELPSDLHQRICAAAQQAGLSAHDMILQALEDLLDRQDAEVQEDDHREQALRQTGMSIPHADVREYFERRMRGEDVAKPITKKFQP